MVHEIEQQLSARRHQRLSLQAVVHRRNQARVCAAAAAATRRCPLLHQCAVVRDAGGPPSSLSLQLLAFVERLLEACMRYAPGNLEAPLKAFLAFFDPTVGFSFFPNNSIWGLSKIVEETF